MQKCAACRRKFSPEKVRKERDLIAMFCRGETAHHAARTMTISYPSVTARYKRLRLLAAAHLEQAYESQRHRVAEFEEYIYLEASKRCEKRHIFDAHNFITFDYGGRVYNLMMPSLHRFKHDFLEDSLDGLYYEEFARFLRIHRIAKLQKSKNTITDFWEFFEGYILRYKGIRQENFPYYLKEAEFKFNYSESEQYEILTALWFR
jgi:transposase-like protein